MYKHLYTKKVLLKEAGKGFTILEVIVVIVILGIMTAFAVNRYHKTVRYNQLEKEAWNVMQFLSTAKPHAMKNDSRAKVKFTSSACSLFVDTSYNLSGYWKFVSRLTLSSPVSFGLPASPPTSAPPGATLPLTGKPAGVNWDTCVSVSRNTLGTINPGSVYIRSSKVPSITFCVRTTSSQQSFKMFKWGGSLWSAL